MTRQRVGGIDVVTGAFERAELLAILTAASKYAAQRARQNGVRSPILDAGIEHLTRLAREFEDRDTDTPTARPQPRSRHADTPATANGAPSGPSSPNGSARMLTTRDIAEHFGLSRRTIQRHAAQGLLDAAVSDGRGTYAIDPASVPVWAATKPTRKAPNDGVDTPRAPQGDG